MKRQLLKLVAQKDVRAFRQFYEKYRSKVFSYAYYITKSKESSEDIVHDIFLKVWESGNLEHIENIDAFLYTITRNHTLELFRKRILEYKIVGEIAVIREKVDQSTEELLALNDTNESLRHAINLLPAKRRAVFRLCKEEGLNYEQAAARLNLSKFTVKTHMQLALRFLRHYLKNAGILSLNFLLLSFF